MQPFGDGDVYLARAERPTGAGVLVLAGSSGRVDVEGADVLASAGAIALAIRWFGGERQPSLPCEIPIETFVDAINRLEATCDRIGVLGLSYGAEAALLTAVRDPRIDAVVALAPTDVAWEGDRRTDDDPRRSKWTWRGEPVPFVPLDRAWAPAHPMPSFRALYERSREVADKETLDAARIPVERFGGDLVLVAGGDDQVWPSVPSAQAIGARRAELGLKTLLVENPKAGHSIVFPGQVPSNPSRRYLVGGDPGAPRRLGALAWPAIRDVLQLN